MTQKHITSKLYYSSKETRLDRNEQCFQSNYFYFGPSNVWENTQKYRAKKLQIKVTFLKKRDMQNKPKALSN